MKRRLAVAIGLVLLVVTLALLFGSVRGGGTQCEVLKYAGCFR